MSVNVVMSQDPEPVIDMLWSAGYDIADSIHPASPTGQIIHMMSGLDEALITIDDGMETITPLIPLLSGTSRIRGPQQTGQEEDTPISKETSEPETRQRDELNAQVTRRQALDDLHRKADQYMQRRKQAEAQDNDERKR